MKALEYNPNYSLVYDNLGGLYEGIDNIKAFEYLIKALAVEKGGPLMTNILNDLGDEYSNYGFYDKARNYYEERYKSDKDSISYLTNLTHLYFCQGNFEKELELREKTYLNDSTNRKTIEIERLAFAYSYARQYEKALYYWIKYLDKSSGDVFFDAWPYILLCYDKAGLKEKCDLYFNRAIKDCERIRLLGRNTQLQISSYSIQAMDYSVMGEKDKALQILKIYSDKLKSMHYKAECWNVNSLKFFPTFDNIRDDPRFQQIVSEIEANYQAEHDRIRKWLEENKML